MLNNRATESELFQNAFGPGVDCPTLEELESLASRGNSQPHFAEHVKSCAYCQTELHLLKSFEAAGSGEMSREEIKAAALLQKRSHEILPPQDSDEAREPWWKAWFSMRGMAQASFALAVLLAVAGVGLYYRTTIQSPSLNGSSQAGPEVLRSAAFAVISPSGDVNQTPSEVRWEKVPNAANYQVHLLEVDRNELWKAETKEDHIVLPPAVRSRIVPAKTLLLEIDAYDSSGSKVGETGLVRFRLLQNRDGH